MIVVGSHSGNYYYLNFSFVFTVILNILQAKLQKWNFKETLLRNSRIVGVLVVLLTIILFGLTFLQLLKLDKTR